ncbi:Protein LURP-one-related 12, partial [Mucuna pruriens]
MVGRLQREENRRVKRASTIGRSHASLTVGMYDNPDEEYQIEGCFSQHCCTIFNVIKGSVAEIRGKMNPTTSVMLGKDVFFLCVKPGFDAAFAMSFVRILNQINGEDYVDSNAITEPVDHNSHFMEAHSQANLKIYEVTDQWSPRQI